MTEKKFFADGIHSISNDEYHSANGISRSTLMLLDKSPYHFWYKVYSGEYEQKPATPAMVLGSAFHTMLLEPALFEKEYAVKPKLEKLPPEVRKKDVGAELYEQYKSAVSEIRERNRIALEDFESQSQSKIVLSEDECAKLFNMVSLTKKHNIVDTLLEGSQFEQSIFWTDRETGIQFKARPDIWSPKVIVDLKTTNDSAPYKLQRAALDHGYYLQAGMMYEACKAIEMPFEMFVILAVEKEAPYVPAAFMLDDEALQFGIDQFTRYKRQLAECINADSWPGYSIQELSVPQFAVKQLENEEA